MRAKKQENVRPVNHDPSKCNPASSNKKIISSEVGRHWKILSALLQEAPRPRNVVFYTVFSDNPAVVSLQ